MLKLYGHSVSNHFNKVYLALLEKNIPFDFEEILPNSEASFLAMSPMGKIPLIHHKECFSLIRLNKLY